MDDIRRSSYNACAKGEPDGCHQDPEEIMRRVPGLTRKEAEHITTLGLTPDEEIEYAYMVYNNGIDVFYKSNLVFMGR